MLDTQCRVVVSYQSRQVIKLKQGDTVTVIAKPSKPCLSVVSVGAQGPVGTVAEEVLSKVEQAEQSANEAKSEASAAHDESQQTQLDMDQMLTDMTNRFNYHAGVISA